MKYGTFKYGSSIYGFAHVAYLRIKTTVLRFLIPIVRIKEPLIINNTIGHDLFIKSGF